MCVCVSEFFVTSKSQLRSVATKILNRKRTFRSKHIGTETMKKEAWASQPISQRHCVAAQPKPSIRNEWRRETKRKQYHFLWSVYVCKSCVIYIVRTCRIIILNGARARGRLAGHCIANCLHAHMPANFKNGKQHSTEHGFTTFAMCWVSDQKHRERIGALYSSNRTNVLSNFVFFVLLSISSSRSSLLSWLCRMLYACVRTRKYWFKNSTSIKCE